MSRAVADDLRAAQLYLSSEGWAQHAAVSECGVCLAFALNFVTGYAPSSDRSRAARSAVFRLIDANEHSDIADWNDAPGRTFADVLALLDKAIAAEEARP